MLIPRFLSFALLLLCLESQAINSNRLDKETPIAQSILGVSTYVGRISNDENEQALYVGASMYMYFFNWALEARSFPSDTFQRDNMLQPYVGLGLGRLLQVQRGVDFTSTTRLRIVSEIAFDEFVDKRNHWILQGFVEQIHTSSDNKRRYGLALGYTF
jgi:hypothetical protein